MRARPHHLIDIIAQYGADVPLEPSDYGHAVHSVAAELLSHPETEIEFGLGADDICAPCRHLVEGRCDDVLSQLSLSPSKQDYNDALDGKLLAFLGMREGQVMTFSEYLQVLRAHLEGLAELCAHPGEEPQGKRQRIERGLQKLGAV